MAAPYTIKIAKNAGVKDNPHGGTLVKWYVTLADEQGAETADVYVQKKPENPLNPGDTIYGRLEQGEYGWRLYPEQNPNGASAPSGGSSEGLSRDDYWQRKEDRDIVNDRRRGRAHAQDMGLRAIQLWYEDLPTAENVFQSLIEEWTDWFDRDVLAKGADLGGGHTRAPAHGNTAADVSAKGFVSQPQQQLFERLLREAGAKPETVNAVVLYASEALSGRQGGAISEAIDGLKSDDPSVRRSTGKTLALAAEEWRKKQPNAPTPDTDDLPPADGMAVGAADDDIPF